jgi:hypothetical protein
MKSLAHRRWQRHCARLRKLSYDLMIYHRKSEESNAVFHALTELAAAGCSDPKAYERALKIYHAYKPQPSTPEHHA